MSASERNASHTSHRRSVSTAAVECPLGRETATQVAGTLRQGRRGEAGRGRPAAERSAHRAALVRSNAEVPHLWPTHLEDASTTSAGVSWLWSPREQSGGEILRVRCRHFQREEVR